MCKSNERNKLRLVHLITDEKFPDSAYDLFEKVLPGCNDFVLLETKKKILYLKKIEPIRLCRYSHLNSKFINYINTYDALIIHGMNKVALEVVHKSNRDLKVFWIGLGYDYYDIIYKSPFDMMKPLTRIAFSSLRKEKKIILSVILNFARVIRDFFLYRSSFDKHKSLEKVNYFCPVLESEYFSVKKNIKGWNASYIDWNYANSAKIADGDSSDSFTLGENILLGNSATPSNNHLDALYFLKNYEHYFSKNTKIITPLSYGNSNYADLIIDKGKDLFGDRFVHLAKMYQPEDYSKILESCGYYFMNHIRQQAGNNIAQALSMGGRVILDKRNPFYSFYKNNGAIINSIDDVRVDPGLLSRELTNDEMYTNKKILKATRGKDIAISKTINLVNNVCRW